MPDTSDNLAEKILNVFVDAVVKRLFSDEAFTTEVVQNFAGKLPPTELTENLLVTIDKRIDEYRTTLKTELREELSDVFDEKVEEAVRNFSVDSDDVHGLDSAIENAVENLTIDADNVNDLDDAIGSYLDENPENVRVNAENVEDLPDAIVQAIEGSDEIQASLRKAILKGLTITVDARIDGKPIENVAVETVRHA